MNKKSILPLAGCAALIIGAIVLVMVVMTSTMQEESAEAKGNTSEVTATSVESADRKAAEELVGESYTKDEISDTLGDWNKFEMTSNGCERGVYAGRFYYDDYTIFSRTYDKGQTFSIVSIN